MILFLFGCAILLALAALFVFRPGRRGRAREVSEANLDWYALRLRELEPEGDEALLEDARLRMLEEMPADEQADTRVASADVKAEAGMRRLPAVLLWVPVVILASLLYWQIGAAGDVTISERLSALEADPQGTDIDALMASIEARLSARPDNQGYLSLLGRYHMSREDFAAAERAYLTLAEKAPSDARAAAMAAQASYLASARELTPEAQLMAERALAIDPMQRTALGLLGMAAFEQGQYRAAINYWERLREMEDPGSQGAEMLDEVLAAARSRIGEREGEEFGQDAAPTGDSAALLVRIERPDSTALADSDTVFVLARGDESASRMPIAVQRLRAADLPTTVRLDDTNSMAGQSLAAAGPLRVFVQVSANGAPGEENASFTGVSDIVEASAEGSETTVSLTPTGR